MYNNFCFYNQLDISLSKKEMKKQNIITLKHLLINGKKHIGIEFINNPAIEIIIKSISSARWSDDYNMFYINNTKKNFTRISL